MKETESIRLGSIIRVTSRDHTAQESAEVIGFVIARGTKIRVRYTVDDLVELRDDLTNDNTILLTY